MTSEIAAFIFGAVACSIGVGTVLWRVITLKLSAEILLLRHDLEKKDLQIANLQDVQVLSHHGLEEKFEHFSGRIKSETSEASKHLRQIEHFLSKTTAYEPRE